MKIKTRLTLNSIVSVGVMVLMIASLIWAWWEVSSATDNARIVSELRKVTYERTILRDEYIQNNENRPKIQWFSKTEELRSLLKQVGARFTGNDGKVFLEEMQRSFDDTVSIFYQIVKKRDRDSNSKADAVFPELERRLMSQLRLKVYVLNDGINKLGRSADNSSAAAWNRGIILLVAFIVVVVLMTVSNSLVLNRMLTSRIAGLQAGAATIGGGDLDYRIDIVGDDELSQLSRSFNEAAEKLKMSRAALEDSEKRFRAAAEGSMDAFFALRAFRNDDGRISDFVFVDMNRRAEEMLAMPRARVLGRKLCELIPVNRTDGFFEKYVRVVETGETLEEEFPTNPQKINAGWLRHQVVPLADGIAITSRDITERKLAEEEIVRLNKDMRHNVVQLEVANKELESFSYSVSHDLRAPLRHMAGFVELLNKKMCQELDEKSRHYLNVISDSARHMGQLVDDLLSFSRMGRAEMMRLQVDLNGLVREVVHELQAEAKDREVEWKIGPLPETQGDKAMLRLAFVNLISNALKFTRPRQQAAIEIGCTPEGGEDVLYVKDNGVGFDQRYVDKLFSLFQRLHRSDEFEGTGVGLANVRRIIHRHGGRTWAEGAVNEGATFYFSLPKSRGGEQ